MKYVFMFLLSILFLIILLGMIGLGFAYLYSFKNKDSNLAKVFNNMPQGTWFYSGNYSFIDAGEPFEQYEKKVVDYLLTRSKALPDFTVPEMVRLNKPFTLAVDPEACNQKQKISALLIHGLYASPNSMKDLAEHLQKNCIEATAILLPGHATKPGDLLSLNGEVVLKQVEARIQAFINSTPDSKRILIGHSYGGLLSVLFSQKFNQQIHGMILFAPAFFVTKHAPLHASIGSRFLSYLPTNDFGRLSPVFYLTQSINAAKILFSHLGLVTKAKPINTPTMLMISDQDEVTNYRGVISFARKKLANLKLFLNTNDKDSQYELYGNSATYLNSASPEDKVVSMSHLGYFIKWNNPIYSENGPMACIDARNFDCRKPPKSWIQGGLTNIPKNIPISKLTRNPFFERDMNEVVSFIQNIASENLVTDSPKSSEIISKK
ncbi:MAG: alpha/beta fold hydrolase [Methylacidiphilales bacterium]|nr:alpha/beta fold hydrolase [Candidatus Methylacidiphilales bacterium]